MDSVVETMSGINMYPEPLFNTTKITLEPISSTVNVIDSHLQDHFLNTDNLYIASCRCHLHRHNQRVCFITNMSVCPTCNNTNDEFMNSNVIYFHPEIQTKGVGKCHAHIHEPPCLSCINCKTNKKCLVLEPFTCYYTTEAVCCDKVVAPLPYDDIYPSEHYHSLKTLDFFFCTNCKHTHTDGKQCIINTVRCCPTAISVYDYTASFIITAKIPKPTEYIIYDPSLWCKQSVNQFLSFLRAVISIPESVATRYQRYEASKFEVPNLKRYKSGKDSVIRTAVIGFEARGVYQTSTISCTIPYNVVYIPQTIHTQLVDQGYDTDLVCVKRDPSILPTCLYVCMVRVHDDPNVQVITISDQLSRGLNQDQDGDKNVLYFLQRRVGNWHTDKSYQYAVSRLEMSSAMNCLQTLTAKPRYLFSETTFQHLYNHRETLTSKNNVLRRCLVDLKMTPHQCNELFSAYHSQSYASMQRNLMELSADASNNRYISIFDLCGKGKNLTNIYESKAKGSIQMYEMLIKNLKRKTTLTEETPNMIELYNKYIKSSQELSKNGRKQFVTLYAGHDMVAFSGNIYMNKIPLADLTTHPLAFTFMHNEGSLNNFVRDIIDS